MKIGNWCNDEGLRGRGGKVARVLEKISSVIRGVSQFNQLQTHAWNQLLYLQFFGSAACIPLKKVHVLHAFAILHQLAPVTAFHVQPFGTDYLLASDIGLSRFSSSHFLG